MDIKGKQAEFIDAVIAKKEYIMVEAPAGTGKTFSCIQCAKTMSDLGYLMPYQRVLVLTFSRNARAQLLKELSKIPIGDNIYKHIDINNYHSFFKKYLDSYRDTIGINKKLNVMDDEDFLFELRTYAKNQGITLDDSLLCTVIDDYVIHNNQLICVNENSKIKANHSKIKEFLYCSMQFTKETGGICFSQFGCLIDNILKRLPKLALAIAHDYPVIVFDEYQDTNYFQEQFVRKVLQNSKGIFFCDRLQMIYGFRGSTIKRIDMLSTLYPGIVKIEFDEYFRYKNKNDIVLLLTRIRNGDKPDYSYIRNGGQLSISVDCNENWRVLKNSKSKKAQCTLLCKNIFWKTSKLVSDMLNNKKSIAILCRENIESDRLIELFCENNFYPKELTDTKDLTQIAKYIKLLIKSNSTVRDNLNIILLMVCLCTSKKSVFGSSIKDFEKVTMSSLKRKRKEGFKKIVSIISDNLQSIGYNACIELAYKIIEVIEAEGEFINFSRKKFIYQCSRIKDLNTESIDSLMLQRQYTNSFTTITPGLYITTIHQSKGKEFDCVFIVDTNNIEKDRNLLYVSHSRMKEKIYPIKVTYNGTKY